LVNRYIYLCKNRQICFVCRNHNPVLSSFIPFHLFTWFVTRVTQLVPLVKNAGNTYPSASVVFTRSHPAHFYIEGGGSLCCVIVNFVHSVLYIIVCNCVPFLLTIVLPILLRWTASEYHCVIFKCFLIIPTVGYTVQSCNIQWCVWNKYCNFLGFLGEYLGANYTFKLVLGET